MAHEMHDGMEDDEDGMEGEGEDEEEDDHHWEKWN